MGESYRGLSVFSAGYRIFFLSAAVWAVLALATWIAYIMGILGPFAVDLLNWHAHELVFGYAGAVIVGFALTAIPNWTSRDTIGGARLGVLFVFWLGSRIGAILLLFGIDARLFTSVIECIFYIQFLFLASNEVIVAKNQRNYKIIGIFAVFVSAAVYTNLVRVELLDGTIVGWRIGLGLLVILIAVIGGRIIPAFTANWMRKNEIVDTPIMFSGFDIICIGALVVTIALFTIQSDSLLLTIMSFLTGTLHFIRLFRWRGWKTYRSPLVAILHISYMWIPIGFLLLGAANQGFMAEQTAFHAWTVGAVGSMTLAVMCRASLGHAGLALEDHPSLTIVFVAISLAGLVRVSAGFCLDHYNILVGASGIAWCFAFMVFLVRFIPTYFAQKV